MFDTVPTAPGKMARTAVFPRGTPNALGRFPDLGLGVFGKGVLFRVFRRGKILIIFKRLIPVYLFLAMAFQAVDFRLFTLGIPSNMTFIAVMVMHAIG
jgi:hypothetical protein